jgi:hypothetical protein
MPIGLLRALVALVRRFLRLVHENDQMDATTTITNASIAPTTQTGGFNGMLRMSVQPLR